MFDSFTLTNDSRSEREVCMNSFCVMSMCMYSQKHSLCIRRMNSDWILEGHMNWLTKAPVCWLSALHWLAPPLWVWIVNWLITHRTFGTLNDRNEDAVTFPMLKSPTSQIPLWLPSPLTATLFISQCHAERRKWMNTIRYFRTFIPAVRLLYWRPGRRGHAASERKPSIHSAVTR